MTGRVYRRLGARRDLVRHFVYLSERAGLETAHRFRDAVENTFGTLLENPELGARREFKTLRLANVRMWPVKRFRNFLIFYEPVQGGIRILRVIHSKQDYWRVFGSGQ